MKYNVSIYEVWSNTFSVEANSEEEAKEKAKAMQESGEQGNLEYSHTRDSSTWHVDPE